MITIQSVMLVILGFLLASLLGFVVAPAYRARTARLTEDRMRRGLPMTEAEIQADKDRLRAAHAIRVHTLHSQVEQAKLESAHQLIEINRRAAAIATFEGEVDRLKAELEEAQNARFVLEQTVTDRLPRVEHRLAEAKKLLFQRDREIAALTDGAGKQARALQEATQINTQQRAEIERLQSTLSTRGGKSREGAQDPKVDSEVALQAEIEALRARNREQASLVAQLQDSLGSGARKLARVVRADLSETQVPANDADADQAGDREMDRIKRDLADAEAALKSVRDNAEADPAGQSSVDAKLRTYRSKIEDQTGEIARLKAALSAFEAGAGNERAVSLKDSKLAMKARLSSLQVQTASQAETIQRLRTELAAANERLARQGAHFVAELRRVGAGTVPASAQSRRPGQIAARRPLAERITQAEPELPGAAPPIVGDGPGSEDRPRGGADAAAVAGSHERQPQSLAPAKGRLLDRIANLGKA